MVSSVVYGWLVSLPSADVNALAELAVTVSSLRRFHSVTVPTKNELRYCSVLMAGTVKPPVLLTTCFMGRFSVSHPSNLVGRILQRSSFAGVRKSSAGMAGILPSAIL